MFLKEWKFSSITKELKLSDLLKRTFDFTFSCFLLVIFFPVFIIIAILVKANSSGGVFFKQKRVGLNGKAFDIIKFRTMVVGAESQGTGLDSFSDDPRVTKIGKVLRNSSLDELPQLINILKGDMSFVGPRPPVTYSPYTYEEYPAKAKQRFEVKPGVTGWAQVNGRNSLTWAEKFQFDIEYLNKKSFLFDIYIIFLTILKVIKNEGAYDGKNNE